MTMPLKNPLHLFAFLIFFSAYEGRSQPNQAGSLQQSHQLDDACDSYQADLEEWCPTVAPYICGDAGEAGRSVRSVCPTSCKICLVSRVFVPMAIVSILTRTHSIGLDLSPFRIYARHNIMPNLFGPIHGIAPLSLSILNPLYR